MFLSKEAEKLAGEFLCSIVNWGERYSLYGSLM